MIYWSEITNISPVQYYTVQSSGGMLTGPFIGDLALDYASAYSLGELDYHKLDMKRPNYNEIKNFSILWSVAVPENVIKNNIFSVNYMKMMYRNTMLGIDYNGTNLNPAYRVGSYMYKNFYFVQPIRPGNKFYAAVKTDLGIEKLPAALRVGNGKTGLLKIKYKSVNMEDLNNIYINLFTIKNIFNKDFNVDNLHIYYVLNHYVMAGPVTGGVMHELYKL
ncbi:type I-D CRISPR-associated protein Cas5/Csc1 [Picrophilus oshimae]|uniref:Uncharacterized protein n=1 Tax=Picrophilus torridus (strain ATCC 700027 / DSM 9790 / JCM 10055 / NBRC 100828 / KAW 2/3) TaxID=1122961 RepID=Q6L360_PICTO|nr:type I-D CRISPR-associated protein Cas5/Csc1 [Picrophilus oshimae]AAT42591.1 hypothetical protein PTO0006 [Picrophilus oshimae DSM 9789]